MLPWGRIGCAFLLDCNISGFYGTGLSLGGLLHRPSNGMRREACGLPFTTDLDQPP
jgi:hypothetical protein